VSAIREAQSNQTTSREGQPFWRRPALWILVLAMAVRLAAVGLAVGWEQPPSDKSHKYDPVARSLLAGEGFARSGTPTAITPPLYPLLLAAVYGVTGESPTAVRLVLALLDVLQCAVWMFLARLLLGRRIALLTGLGLAVCPYFVFLVVTAGNDTLFLLLHAVFVATLVGAWRGDGLRGFAAAGVAAGAATLCRAVSLFEPLFLAPLLVLGLSKDRRRALRGALVMLLFYAFTLTPWTVRNYAQFGRLVPIQTIGGYTLLIANFAEGDPQIRTELHRGKGTRSTGEGRDAGMIRRGLELVLEDPANFARRSAIRLAKMWYFTHSRRSPVPLGLANAALLTAAAIGLIRLRGRRLELLPVLATAAYFISFHSLLFAIFRYMIPVVPVLIMLAAAALQPRTELEQ